MEVSEIMTKEVITIAPLEEISKAIALMEKNDIKELPVVDAKQRLLGMITFYDLLEIIKVAGKHKVEKLMFSPPTLSPQASIEECLRLINETGVEAIPVVDERGEVLGIVSDYDLLREYAELGRLSRLRVKDLMRTNIPLLRPDDSIGKARRLMNFNRLDRLPVIDKDRRCIGLVLLIDITRKFFISSQKIGGLGARGEALPIMSFSIAGVMRSFAERVYPETSVNEAIRIMLSKNLKGIQVVDHEGRPLGILMRRDVLSWIAKGFERKGIRVRFSGFKPDWESMQRIRNLISSNVRRIGVFSKQTQEIDIHVKSLGKERKRYEVKIRVRKPGVTRFARKIGHDLGTTIKSALRKLERIFRSSR
jgi:CBS domain-containing protein/ribosome-associated translation inhibitor RaiA